MSEDPLLARMYRLLYRIRRVEEEIARVYPTDKVQSPVHLSIGQEAVSVGVCCALVPEDIVFGTYRSHALYLAKGGDLKRMIAELYGKATGCAGGKGGSMHLIDVAHGVLGTSAVVATTIPHALGYAFALRARGSRAIVVSFMGDGATEEGVFHESMNLAVLKRLPVLFVCENNRYAVHTHQRDRQGTDDLCARVRAYGMHAERIGGGDPFAVHAHASELKRTLPAFLECMTYRWKEHVGPGEDYDAGYRTREEAKLWMDADALPRLAARLDAATRGTIQQEEETSIREAFRFAEESPFPAPEALFSDVFKE